jgi:hypothetical protein
LFGETFRGKQMDGADTTERIEFRVNQTWCAHNGDRARHITDIRVAGIRDRNRPSGSILVCWVVSADKWGTCSERAFRRWIKYTNATLQAGIK